MCQNAIKISESFKEVEHFLRCTVPQKNKYLSITYLLHIKALNWPLLKKNKTAVDPGLALTVKSFASFSQKKSLFQLSKAQSSQQALIRDGTSDITSVW